MSRPVWILRLALIFMFTMTGALKLTQPKDWLALHVEWVKPFAPETIKAIGAIELLCVTGLAAPAVVRTAAFVSPIASLGIMLVMAGAAVTHLRIGELGFLALNSALFIMAAVVGRAGWSDLVRRIRRSDYVNRS